MNFFEECIAVRTVQCYSCMCVQPPWCGLLAWLMPTPALATLHDQLTRRRAHLPLTVRILAHCAHVLHCHSPQLLTRIIIGLLCLLGGGWTFNMADVRISLILCETSLAYPCPRTNAFTQTNLPATACLLG